MSERLPYEEQLSQQWNDLPLPDENMAWADMKRRLEEDDYKPLLPFWLRGCAGWGLLGLLLLGLGWWIVRPEKWFKGKEEKKIETKSTVPEKGIEKQMAPAFTLKDSNTTTVFKNDSVVKKDSSHISRPKPAGSVPGETIVSTKNTKAVDKVKGKGKEMGISNKKQQSKCKKKKTKKNKKKKKKEEKEKKKKKFFQ